MPEVSVYYSKAGLINSRVKKEKPTVNSELLEIVSFSKGCVSKMNKNMSFRGKVWALSLVVG